MHRRINSVCMVYTLQFIVHSSLPLTVSLTSGVRPNRKYAKVIKRVTGFTATCAGDLRSVVVLFHVSCF